MSDEPNEDQLFFHLQTVMSIAAALVGVCLTVIGLIGVIKSQTKIETLCDDLMAADALLFLLAVLLSYAGLRTPLRRRCARVAIVVDVIFCLGLATMVLACTLLVWTIL